jgi:4-hydroxybenzoate polyprenyltransferase
MTAAGETASSLLHRLWIYQRERIPLGRTALLLAVFSAASINVSAQLAGRTLPGWGTYAVAFAVALIFFFQLRACDEVKDAEDDRLYRPERPIPRGLVSLRLIVALALAAVPVAAIVTATLDVRLLVPLTLVWLWMGLMTAEFFVPHWLKPRPLLYVVSHMLIMPLIDLFITACEWLPRAGSPPAGLWLFLVLSFLNGCVLEIGRKIYAPQNERTGVETYSMLLGPRKATLLWGAVLLAAFVMLVAVGSAVEAPRLVAAVGFAGLAVCLTGGWMFWRTPDAAAQKRLDTMSGLWVLTCYGSAGFVPLLLRWI